ncbi:hypothetical protein ACSBR2_030147 [Camellia fascicularis]
MTALAMPINRSKLITQRLWFLFKLLPDFTCSAFLNIYFTCSAFLNIYIKSASHPQV